MQADIKWLDDPETFRVNQLPAHSDHCFYRNYREWQDKRSSLKQSLNGQWKFKFTKNPMERPTGFYHTNFDTNDFTQIEVPSEIEMTGFAQNNYINDRYPWEGKIYRRPAYALRPDDKQEGSFSQGKDNTVGCYLKHFDLDEKMHGLPIHLYFEGVERAMYVWLNGHFVGYAEDSFTPSEFDLTPFIKDKDNLLAVEVFKHSTASWLEDQDMFRFSGIFRNVSLLALPETHLEDLALKPLVNDDFKSGIFNATLKLTGKLAGKVRVKVQDEEGKSLLDCEYPLAKKLELKDEEFKQIHLWDNHDPYLYQLLIEIHDESGQLIELIPYQFGFRRIEIDENKVVRLNGQRLIINGVNRHEWDAKRGRAITMDDMKQDIQIFQANHINAVRTCHYSDQIPWYGMCDQAGIYMMAENNLETHGTWANADYNVPGSHQEWLAAVIDRARTNYETFKNHTAILFWSLGNESYAGEDIAQMNEFYKKHDDTRLTHYEGVCHVLELRDRISDLESRMYMPPKDVEEYLKHDPAKPFVECEYMHDMGNSDGGMGSYIELIDKYPQYLGGFIWDYIDQAILVKDKITGQEVMRYGGDFDDRLADNEFSGDGLLFADRKPKPAMQEVRYYYGLHK
ncbi:MULTISPECIES: glycoside hydrolase family 2 TIM barrel-domain containing protein [Lactobacillus]|uniref:beta-galactosidase n=1 Tax=Lactobacillus xujianguonis TaxID=2495899 RepID=A0A437SVN7_9LACO|nr:MULTISPECIES: glycoside hydrolase family 2 TIM barrel-domain containing protein [Lactobacillus]RVU70985.1 beta-galactosidase [Lactobacillus xujianguonis]RVU73945.1 beta-galactosidase [Lactobacillus xujianguonis]